MAAYDLEEQEQLSTIKAWWAKNGNLVSIAVTVLAVAVVGWTGWQRYQGSQAEKASQLYAEAFRAAQADDSAKLQEMANQLTKEYPGQMQSALAALLAARADIEKKDSKAARLKLEWVSEHAADPLLKDLARLRLGALLLDDKAYDDALRIANAGTTNEYAGRFAELRGDVLFEQGKIEEAKAAFKQAVEKYGNASELLSLKNIAQTKLEALGGN